MRFRSPQKRDLRVGNTIDIYDEDGNKKGRGKLIRRSISRYRQDNLPYVGEESKKEKGEDDAQEPIMWIYGAERWVVEWINHNYYPPGNRTATDVHYYWCKTSDMNSFFEYHREGNKGVEAEDIFIFLEESAMLFSEKTRKYRRESIKALKRIMRMYNGELVILTHSPALVKERFELSGLKFRILEFIRDDGERGDEETGYLRGYSYGIAKFLEDRDFEDFIVISGGTVITCTDRVKYYPDGFKTGPEDE